MDKNILHTGKQHILSLVMVANDHFKNRPKEFDSFFDEEIYMKHGAAYVYAANALLCGFHELHTELIEHPSFMQARKNYKGY